MARKTQKRRRAREPLTQRRTPAQTVADTIRASGPAVSSGHGGHGFARVELGVLRFAALAFLLISLVRLGCHDVQSLSHDLAAAWHSIAVLIGF